MNEILALLILFGIVGSIIAAGVIVGRRLPLRYGRAITLIVAGVGALLLYANVSGMSELPPKEAADAVIVNLFYIILWMFFCMSLMIGHQSTEGTARAKRDLAAWTEQAKRDDLSGSKLASANSLVQVAALCSTLKLRLEAVEAYATAARYYAELGVEGHPTMSGFYVAYAAALRADGRTAEAEQVQAKITAISPAPGAAQ